MNTKSQRQGKIKSVHATNASLCNKPKYCCVSASIAATPDRDQGLNPEIVCYSKHMRRPHRSYSHVKRARTRAKVLHTVKVKLETRTEQGNSQDSGFHTAPSADSWGCSAHCSWPRAACVLAGPCEGCGRPAGCCLQNRGSPCLSPIALTVVPLPTDADFLINFSQI